MEENLVPFLPSSWIDKLREQSALAKQLADADFLLELTIEILPEYTELLNKKKVWLQSQLDQLKGLI